MASASSSSSGRNLWSSHSSNKIDKKLLLLFACFQLVALLGTKGFVSAQFLQVEQDQERADIVFDSRPPPRLPEDDTDTISRIKRQAAINKNESNNNNQASSMATDSSNAGASSAIAAATTLDGEMGVSSGGQPMKPGNMLGASISGGVTMGGGGGGQGSPVQKRPRPQKQRRPTPVSQRPPKRPAPTTTEYDDMGTTSSGGGNNYNDEENSYSYPDSDGGFTIVGSSSGGGSDQDYASGSFMNNPMRHFGRIMNNMFNYAIAPSSAMFDASAPNMNRGSMASSAAFSDSDGFTRLASSVTNNGRTRGIITETRNGRTQTRRIGAGLDDDDDDERYDGRGSTAYEEDE